MSKSHSTVNDTSIVITRTVKAERDLVWRVLTEADHIKHFWGPNGFTNTITQMDVQVGGVWRFVMHGPANPDGTAGTDYKNWIRYTEVEKPNRLAYDHGGADEHEVAFKGSIDLEAMGNGETKVTLTVFASKEFISGAAKYAVTGGEQNLERLDVYLQNVKS
jgi:uncharacterized protein YndB with AHSA1/START domain